MPKRRKGEKKSKYVSRCMGNEEMHRKFPKSSQRAAVCYSYAEEEEITEKAVSKSQRRLMGMAHAYQKGELSLKGMRNKEEIKKIAKSMEPSDLKKFAKTKEKDLPKHVKKETHQRTFKEFLAEWNDEHPEEGDYMISDLHDGVYVNQLDVGKMGNLGKFTDIDEAYAAIRDHMKQQQFWPDVWHVNDHGNLTLVSHEVKQ